MAYTPMAWSGNCRDCDAIVIIAPYDSRTDRIVEAGPDEWDTFPSCYLCDGSIDWNGSDPAKKYGL